MPWQETDVRSERIRFVVEAVQGRESMSDLCRRYGVSRKTGYKWLRRYEELGQLSALVEESRRPHLSPQQTPREVEEQVVSLRDQCGWGSRKLRVLLAAKGLSLSRSTIDRILHRYGRIEKPERQRPAVLRFERSSPNELVQMDFKGHYPLLGGGVCHPLSLLDDHSRYALALAPLASQSTELVQPLVQETFERHGVPEAMLVDHGTPWWSSTNGHGLTRFSVSLIRQGVRLIYSGVGHPQTQGKVERFHREIKAWLRHHGTPRSLGGFQDALEDFRQEYNEVRPHEALDLKTPASRYTPSTKPYLAEPAPWIYPPGAQVRTLSNNGCVYLDGKYQFVCHALGGEQVRCDFFEDRILVSYRHMLIRELDRTTGASRTIVQPYGPTGHDNS